ncbi:DUF4287 domain-containing protein [bacterium]|nr:DUF4287 domain-containing protein [bacterium]
MIENLHKTTGKTLEEWIEIVHRAAHAKHGEAVAYLKQEHGMTHGFANLVVHKARSSDAGSAAQSEDLIEKQYAGKPHFRPLYDALIAEIQRFGADVEIAPKNTYVSLRRAKQFALLQPATKTRFEIGLNLKGEPAEGILALEKPGAMCSHKIALSTAEEIQEVLPWIRKAYDRAG